MADTITTRTSDFARGARAYAAELERQASELRKYADLLVAEEIIEPEPLASATGQVVQSNQVLEAK